MPVLFSSSIVTKTNKILAFVEWEEGQDWVGGNKCIIKQMNERDCFVPGEKYWQSHTIRHRGTLDTPEQLTRAHGCCSGDPYTVEQANGQRF